MKKMTAFSLSTIFLYKTLTSKALHRIAGIILFLIIFSSFSPYSIAGLQEKQDISKMVQGADLIIRGKVVSAESQWKEDSRGRHIYTSVNVKVLDKIKGSIKDNALAFEVIGGAVDGIGELVSDTPAFATDEDAIMFLAGNPLTIRQGIDSKIPVYNGRVYRNNSAMTADSFVLGLKNLEQDPNAQVFGGESYQTPIEGTANIAECYKYNNLRWPDTWPVVSYYINENTSDCTGEGAAVQAAANTWNGTGSGFTFHYAGSHHNTSSSQNNVNEIMWGTTSGSVATTYFWYYLPGDMIECDIVFNDAYNWSSTTPTSSQMDVQSVALHELGHWLNLDDLYNSEDSGNVMYGYISNGQVKRVLQPCDISGICLIYGGCPLSYTLTVNSSGASGVSISSSTGHGGTTNYTKTVTSGATVALTAPSTAGGKTFTGWTGDITSSGQTISFTMNGYKSVTANYVTVVPNDMFANAITISGASGQTTGSNVGATKETGEPSHAGNSGGASVWWKWTATSNGQITIDTFGSSFDTLLAVYTGNSVGSLTLKASNDDAGGGAQSQVTFAVISGTTYRIAVDGYSGATGSIILNWFFVSTDYTLTVNSSGASSVSISSSTGHSGTTNYTRTVSLGTTVTLTAPLSPGGHTFINWTGDVASSNRTISFAMNGNKTVTANFISITPPVLHGEPNMTPGLCNIISWDAAPEVKEYYAECSSDPCFLVVDYTSGWITRTSYQFCGLTSSQEYWYRVKSGLSAWSQTSQAEFQSDTLIDTTAAISGDVVLIGGSVDTVGSTTDPFDMYTDSFFNGFLVTTETTLTQIEIYLGISTSIPIEFVVYEGGPLFTDTYNRIHSSTLASSGTGTKFYSSGSVSIHLKAGTHYMIGAVLNGSATEYCDEIDSSPTFADHTGWGYYYGFPSPSILSDISEDPSITFYHRYTTTQTPGHISPGSVVSAPINLPAGGNWGIVDFNKTTPVDTALTVDILPAAGSIPIPGYEDVSAGFDISGISAPTIRLRANLSTNDSNSTPALHDWSVTYTDPAGIESGWSNVESSLQCGTPGDLNGDCKVDFADLKVLCEQWLQPPGIPSADIAPQPNGDGIVNFLDFALLAENWMK